MTYRKSCHSERSEAESKNPQYPTPQGVILDEVKNPQYLVKENGFLALLGMTEENGFLVTLGMTEESGFLVTLGMTLRVQNNANPSQKFQGS